MNFFDFLTLFGGLAMFLYGMRLMGDALKESSSGALKVAMEHVTNNPLKAFFLGLVITAVIQSSTATIVITSGLVSAGILTLHQSLGIIIGANVGTTVTGQIIRLLDLDASSGSILRLFQPSSLAPIALIAGIVLIMGFKFKNSQSIGHILIGFGILFSGLLNMTGAVNTLAESGIVENLFRGLGENPIIGYFTGAGIAFMLQSSSATIGILQAFSASGALTFKAIYAVIVGIYLGDCVTTAIVCSIGAEPEAKRVGVVNILFNLSETVAVLAVVTVIHRIGLLDSIWNMTVNSGVIANTNTIFNLTCAVVMFPLLGTYEKISRRLVADRTEPEGKYQEKLEALNPVFFDTPALALRSCYDVLLTSFHAAAANIKKAEGLIEVFDEKIYQEVLEEEDQIDLLTDRLSHYMVEVLPHIKEELHVSILDHYYKVSAEFERLGDHAKRMSDTAQYLKQESLTFSPAARAELKVLEDLLDEILAKAELAFRRRNIEAAYQVEPMVHVADEVVTVLKRNHLQRMGQGICSIYADASFTNLLNEMQRIANVCSNIGMATIIRVRPELGDQEHLYYTALHSGKDAEFNQDYKAAHQRVFEQLTEAMERYDAGTGSA